MATFHLFGITLAAVLTTGLGQQCTQDNYDRCTGRVRPYMGSVIGGIVPTIELDYLDQHCQEIESAFSCVDDFLYRCHADSQQEIRAIAHAYRWICEDGLQGYRDHATCLHDSAVITEGRRCNSTFHNNVDDLISNTQHTSPLTLICKYVNDYMDCVQNAVHELCTEEASVWMREFDTRLLQPTYEDIGCTFHDFRVDYMTTVTPQPLIEEHWHHDSHYGVISFLIVLMLILSAALIFSCVMFVVMRRRLLQQINTPTVAYNGAVARTGTGAPAMFVNPLATAGATAPVHAPVHTQAPPLPQKSPYASDEYPASGQYVRFEDEPIDNPYATTASAGYAITSPQYTNSSPEEVDITSGVGGYDLSLATGQTELTMDSNPEPASQPQKQGLDNPIYSSDA